VLREHYVTGPTAKVEASSECEIENSLEAIRSHLPKGLHNLGREKNDEPQIVEVWV
jgi:hypothetical protein